MTTSPIESDPRYIAAAIASEQGRAASYRADVLQTQANAIRTLVDAGKSYQSEAAFDPESVVEAVMANDLSQLKHKNGNTEPVEDATIA